MLQCTFAFYLDITLVMSCLGEFTLAPFVVGERGVTNFARFTVIYLE